MSHREAIEQSEKFQVAGLVDRDGEKLERIATEIGRPPTATQLEELNDDRADVIVICTPSTDRVDIVEAALEMKPRVVIIEKPMACDLTAALRIAETSRQTGTPILINFQRRFDTKIRKWREFAPQPARSITVTYGKGLYNYASHAIDLMLDWYGSVTEVRSLSNVGDLVESDPSLSFAASLETGTTAVFIGHDSLGYDLWDMEIVGDTKRLSLRAGGAEAYLEEPEMSRFYTGYAHLRQISNENAAVGGFSELYDAVAGYLDHGTELGGCNVERGLENMAILDAVHKSTLANGVNLDPSEILRVVNDE